MQGQSKPFSDDEFLVAIKSSTTHREAMGKLGYNVTWASSNKSKYKKTFNRLKPDISHFNLKSRSSTDKTNNSSIETFYNSYQSHAKLKNKDFKLSLQEFKSLVIQKCYYCGSEGTTATGNKSDRKVKYLYCGIDRKDNSIGYEINNCVPCCSKCNFMKTKLSDSEFLDQIIKIYEYRYNPTNIRANSTSI